MASAGSQVQDQDTDLRVRLNGRSYVIGRVVNGEIGADLWASSVAMAEHLEETYGGATATSSSIPAGSSACDSASVGQGSSWALEGKKALELGSGCGFLAMVLWNLGCHVVATDKENMHPLLVDNLTPLTRLDLGQGQGQGQGNNLSSSVPRVATDQLPPTPRVQVVAYDWTAEPPPAVAENRPYDLVVCADCLYAAASVRSHPPWLCAFVCSCLSACTSGTSRTSGLSPPAREML